MTPSARRWGGRGLRIAAATVIAPIFLAALLGACVGGEVGTTPSRAQVRPTPPNPAAFASDPRLERCYGETGAVEFVFEMGRARDYHRYVPGMLLSPELDVDSPGLVVVFGQGVTPLVGLGGAAPPPGQTWPPTPSPAPNHRFVCVLVTGTPTLYGDVDISGMSVTPIPSPSR